MAGNEIVIIVTSRDQTKPGMDSAEGRAAALEARMKALGEEFKHASTQTDDFGHKLASTANFGEFLDSKIAGLAQRTKMLGDELKRTGDVDVFRHLADAEAESAVLNEIRSKLPKAIDDGSREGGKSFVTRMREAIGGGAAKMVEGLSNIPWAGVIFKPLVSAMESAPPELQAAIGAAVAAAIVGAAALIGAALNAVLISGVGLGGIAVGIIGQIHDPGVRTAFAGLGHDLMGELAFSTGAFAQPLQQAARIFKATIDNLFTPERFSGLAKEVEPLAAGIQSMFRNMGPGLDKILAAAEPILMTLAQEMPGLGKAISSMFASFADGGQGAQEGLRALMFIIDSTIRAIGFFIDVLSHLMHWFDVAGEAVSGFLNKFGLLPIIGDKVHAVFKHFLDGGVAPASAGVAQFGRVVGDTAVDFDSLSGAISKTVNTTDTLSAQMTGKLFAATMGIDQATLHWHESLTNLGEQLAKNGTQIDRHTGSINLNSKAGQENESAILATVQANMQAYQSWIAAGGSATEAAGQYDANTAALEKQMHQAGYTQRQIDGLIGKYVAIPDTVNTDIATNGLSAAIDGLSELLSLISGVRSKRQINIDITNRINSNMGHLATGGIVGAASGMIRSGMTWVGEQGPELLRLPAGSQVMSHPDSQRMLTDAVAAQQPTRGDGATVFLGPGLDSAFASYLQRLIATGQIKIS